MTARQRKLEARGGQRKGAGRKPTGRIPYSVTLRPETVELLRARLAPGERSEFIDRVLSKALSKL